MTKSLNLKEETISTGTTHWEGLKQKVLLEEIRIISESIMFSDKQSSQIKQWCLTLWIGCWSLVLAKHILSGIINSNSGYWVSFGILLIPLMFAIQDTSIKRNQRKLLWRTRILHSELNAEPESKKILEGFRFYDVAGFNQAHKVKYFEPTKEQYEDFISLTNAFRQSTSVKVFYSTLIALNLILSVVINTIHFSS